MKSFFKLAAVPTFFVLLAGPLLADSVEDAAYEKCTEILREALTPTGSRDDIGFAPLNDVNWSKEDEIYFAFQSGKIDGAIRLSTDATPELPPSASCGGSISGRKLTWITANGNDVISDPVGF